MSVAKTSFLTQADTNQRGCADGANDVLRNDVMLRINDVALRANESMKLSWVTKLYPNTKVLDFREGRVFIRRRLDLRGILCYNMCKERQRFV